MFNMYKENISTDYDITEEEIMDLLSPFIGFFKISISYKNDLDFATDTQTPLKVVLASTEYQKRYSRDEEFQNYFFEEFVYPLAQFGENLNQFNLKIGRWFLYENEITILIYNKNNIPNDK